MKPIITKLLLKLDKYSYGKNVLFWVVITQIVYWTMLLFTIPKVMHYSNGMKILDIMPTGYTAAYAQKLFETLGQPGRHVYLFQQLPLDMIYPALFAISYSLLLTCLFKKILPSESKVKYLSVIPFLGGLFDYLENIGIITMLNIYPNFKFWLADLTSVFSLLKSALTSIFFILLFYGLITPLVKKFKQFIQLKYPNN